MLSTVQVIALGVGVGLLWHIGCRLAVGPVMAWVLYPFSVLITWSLCAVIARIR